MDIRKGDIYYAELVGNGSVQRGERPVIISSSDVNNKFAPTVQVIPLTSNLNKKRLPVHVEVSTDCGLKETSLALAEQEQTIDKRSLIRKIGACNRDVLLQIDNAIRIQRDMEEPVNLPYIKHLVRSVITYNRLMKKIKLSNEDVRYYNTTVQELKKYCENYGIDYKNIVRNTLNEGDETQWHTQKKVTSLAY